MKKSLLSLTLACAYFLPAAAGAADTKFSTLETVDSSGNSTYFPQGTITVTGVVINNPYDMSGRHAATGRRISRRRSDQ